jgi:GPH family glycoside/pentoside/hexuronide:cation symporter
MVYAGIGIGFSYVSPYSMVPDTIEYDAARSGERKEGAYYGIWTFVSKLGTSLSAFISGAILSFGGYAANADQSPSAILAIRLLIGPIPAVILIAAMICIQAYTLDENTYKKIMGQKAGK